MGGGLSRERQRGSHRDGFNGRALGKSKRLGYH